MAEKTQPPDATTDTGLNVGQFKDYWRSQGATESDLKMAFAKFYGGKKAGTVWDSDDVRIRDIPSDESIAERPKGILQSRIGLPMTGEDMAHDLMLNKSREWLEQRGMSQKELWRYRDVPKHLTDKQAQEYLDQKLREENKQASEDWRDKHVHGAVRKYGLDYESEEAYEQDVAFREKELGLEPGGSGYRSDMEKRGGYIPARDLIPFYAGQVIIPDAQVKHRALLERVKKRKESQEWKDKEQVYKDLVKRQKQLAAVEDLEKRYAKIAEKSFPGVSSGAEFTVMAAAEGAGLVKGVTTFALETADRWGVGFDKSKYSYAGDMSPEQIGAWAKQMEDAYAAGGKEVPPELAEAIRRNKIKIARFPALKGDFQRGEDVYEAGKNLIRTDFKDILEKDRWITTNFVNDAGDVLEGLLTLASGAAGFQDSEWVLEAKRSGDRKEYYKRRSEERAKFYRQLGHTALGAVAVMLDNNENGSPSFLEQFEARPLTTWMTVAPVLRAIKYGSLSMSKAARQKASMLLDKWQAEVASKLGPEKWNAMLNAVDRVQAPIQSAWAGAKGFISDRAIQAVPRATEMLRTIFRQPIQTRAEHSARMRRAKVEWENLDGWMKQQGPQRNWSPEQTSEFATKFDNIVKLFPEEEQAQVYMNLEKGIPDDLLQSQKSLQASLDRVPPPGERGFIYQEGDVQIGPKTMPDEPLGQLVARLEQQRRQSGADRDPVFVSTEKEFVDFGGGPSPRLFPDVKDGPRKRFDYWREPQYATKTDRPMVDFGGGPAARLFPDAPKQVFRPTKKGEISAGKRVETDTPKTLHQVFREQTDHVTGKRDPVSGAWIKGRRSSPTAALQHVQRKVDKALTPSMDVELGVAKIPKDFVEPVIHIDPSDLRVNLMQSIGHSLPKGPAGMKAFEALVNTDKILAQYLPLKRSLYDVFEYGITGHRKGTTATTVNGRKVNLYVHPAVNQALTSLDRFMRSKNLSRSQLASLKKRNLNAARAKFNRAMKQFRSKYTWDRAELPESVNAMLDDLVNAGWPKHKRNAQKGKFLKEHAPVAGFREWAQKYHPDTPYEYIPIRSTTVIPEEVLKNPQMLDQWLKENPPGLEQFASQRGIKGKKHTALMKEWIESPFVDEAHYQMVNYLRWPDEGPRTTKGKPVAWVPVPKDVGRKFPDQRIYGPDFQPYKWGKTEAQIIEKPTATSEAAKRASLEADAAIENIPSPEHIQAMQQSLGSARPMSRQERLDIADMNRIQSKMAQLLETEQGVEKAASLLANEIEGTYKNKLNNAARERIQMELDHASALVQRGADNLGASIKDIPGAIPMGPREWLAQFKPKTESGKLWLDMATRRLMPGSRLPVFKEGIYLNRGYTKVPAEMAKKMKIQGDVYMPNFAIRQWKWQRDALDAVFGDQSKWAQFTTYVKGNLTATNLPTLLYNLASNVGLQALTRGPFFFADMMNKNLEYRMFLNGRKFSKDKQLMYEAIEDSGLLSTDFHRMELQHMADGVPDFRKTAIKKKGAKEYLKDVLFMRPISKAYGGTDNLFKLHEAVIKINEAKSALGKLQQPGQYIEMPLSSNTSVLFEVANVKGKKTLFANGKALKNDRQLYDILAEHGKAYADLKFFDYSDLPGWNAILKGRRLDLLFSPFLTFTSKALWLPGFKRGLAREMLSEMPYKTNVPSLAVKSARDRMDTYALWVAALAQSRADYIEGERDMKKVISRNPQSTHMMLYDLVTDPGTIWSRDLRSLDSLEGTKILNNVVEDLFGTRSHHVEAFGEEDGPKQIRFLDSGAPRREESRQQFEEDWQEVSKKFPIHGATFDDIVNNIGFGKGPLLDLLVESEAIGSHWWGHREMTPKRMMQLISPLFIPGTWGKIIDVGAGIQQSDDPSSASSYFTTRRTPLGETYGQVGETDAQFARRKILGVGMTSKPLEKALDDFFKGLQKEWLARTVGTPETHGTLKYDAKYIWEDVKIPKEDRERRVREINDKIDRWDQLIKWSIENRKQRAKAVIEKFLMRGAIKHYGKPK